MTGYIGGSGTGSTLTVTGLVARVSVNTPNIYNDASGTGNVTIGNGTVSQLTLDGIGTSPTFTAGDSYVSLDNATTFIISSTSVPTLTFGTLKQRIHSTLSDSKLQFLLDSSAMGIMLNDLDFQTNHRHQ